MADKQLLDDSQSTGASELKKGLNATPQCCNADDLSRWRIARRTGIIDQDVLRDLITLGYTPATVVLLDLVPLIQVAWADGGVSADETTYILQAAHARGVGPDSVAYLQLRAWLAERPTSEFFQQNLNLIGSILRRYPPQERESAERDLRSSGRAIASEAYGVVGLRTPSPSEERILGRIVHEVRYARPP